MWLLCFYGDFEYTKLYTITGPVSIFSSLIYLSIYQLLNSRMSRHINEAGLLSA